MLEEFTVATMGGLGVAVCVCIDEKKGTVYRRIHAATLTTSFFDANSHLAQH